MLMYKVTLYDMNCSPVSDGVAIFFTEDINHFEQNWAPLCIKTGDNERVERFLRSKKGEIVSDYYSDDSELNIVQEDPDAEVLYEKHFTLRDVTFFATNAYGWYQQYHVDHWDCVFRWIRFRKDFFCVFQYKAYGVCRIDGEKLRDVNCYGNPVLINTKEFVVEFDRGIPIIDHPLSYSDFAENSIETFCWLTGRCFITKEEVDADFKSFGITEDVMDRMFWDVIGEAG